MDSDSDQEDFEQYSELDAFDTDEVEVSPEDEQALAAFMVGCTHHPAWSLQLVRQPHSTTPGRIALQSALSTPQALT